MIEGNERLAQRPIQFGNHVIRVTEKRVAKDRYYITVRLNSFDEDEGLNIGGGETRQGALLDAAQTLNAAVAEILKTVE